MDQDQAEYLMTLTRVHDGLALARGSARTRRGAAVPAQGVGGPVGHVLGMLRELGPAEALADWDHVTRFAEAGAPGPLRFGTARVGVGAGRCADVPVVVPLLGSGHVVINPPDPSWHGTLAHECAAEVSAIVDNLVLRALASTPPKSLLVIGDRFMPAFLDRDDVYEQRLVFDIDPTGPGQMDNLLARLNDDVERIRRTGPEQWRLLILSDLGSMLSAQHMEELAWLLRAGPECGLHAILIDTPVPPGVVAETVHVSPRRIRASTAGPLLDVRPDGVPLPGSPAMAALDERLSRGGVPATGLLPEHWWTESTKDGLVADIGDVGGAVEQVRLGDSPPHALIGGPSGSGKTNFIYALLFSLATRYSPDEVEFHLLDFKESVSFAAFAPSAADPGWLPHARLIGVNINQDREFGLAMLRHLAEQLRIRSAEVKRRGAKDIAGLREADPAGRWPRVVAVIDEFQVLLADRDAVTEEAASLLEDLARRGRSFGIHLVLSSQDVSGIEALWGRPALVAQLTLRIALPGATRVLADDNEAALALPRFHAIVNQQSGVRGHDRKVRIPHFDDDMLAATQLQLWERRRADSPEPSVFDGDHVPELVCAADYRALRPVSADQRAALLGRTFDVADRSAQVVLNGAPGRNIAVIGTRPDEVHGVLSAATASIAKQCTVADARFTVVSGSSDSIAVDLRDLLSAHGHRPDFVARSDIPAFLKELAEPTAPGPRHYVVFVGVDAAHSVLRQPCSDSATGHELLRQILADAPESGVHLVGWWRGVHRLKQDLSDFGSQIDDQIGVWVALDVHGGELSGLPGADLVTWHPQPRRGLWFDRAAHNRPRPLVPFAPARSGESR
ncbi:FtsK/SpoIIIE domain-containing protein [Allokutzneria sp. A3M-2-11 16]|uniref:FtsK/SpoIIIE domain-containing protein n=1 Tax=Allokutzneria sp. A3M-2-11 16 TaxID=2962043 RepID=UPI0020B807BE|nr:FtsK/SpoIIIE domain-containing protein [Allokutzneria sp. A3M-2-11 16]MCP3804922.1 FtsK/SpoIIIE domain-containing protein [Allokutzneria sp. A3M-2-11 16]